LVHVIRTQAFFDGMTEFVTNSQPCALLDEPLNLIYDIFFPIEGVLPPTLVKVRFLGV